MTLPSGTVTFLFTDIEGSTRLMQEVGERYVAAQVAHNEILRDAFASNAGRELRTEGDSFFCVFESAIDACAAAAAAQREFFRHTWPDGVAIRVRMGLHTGEAPLVGNEYIGIDVHHAARVMSAAHGGQIVISDSTQSIAGSSLGPGLSLRDLGMHRLKDLARPERLFQLVVEGVPDQFPALRTLDSTPNNLPTQLTSFVGREEVVAEARRLLAGTRLLTLVGPGGIGKTRLSLQIAAEAVQSFPDGVYFVQLSAVRDPELIASAVAQAIGISVTGNRLPMEAVKEQLAGRRVLLVLDNLEQLLPAGAPVVAQLLQPSPDVKIVASSRAALHVYGEQEMAVAPLRIPDLRALPPLAALSQYEAVKLFIERAVAARHDFQVTNENAPAVAGICERVDGLPLAIELAAARVKLFNPQALLARLETSVSVLGTGSRDLPDRQQTLKGAIAWSYDLLDPANRRLFARFSVFARGASLEQAEAVCGPAEELGVDVLTGLDELADQSLLRRQPDFDEPRLLMLHVIREFAGEMLVESGEADAIRDRHAASYQALAEAAAPHLFGPEQRRWLDRLEMDHDNFRAAFDWAVAKGDAKRAMCLGAAFWRFWQMRGHLREGHARLSAVLALPGAKDHPAEVAAALEAAGGITYWLGDLKAAGGYYRQALDLARAAGDRRAIANALYNYSFAFNVDLSDTPQAVELLVEALAIYRELDDRRGLAETDWALAQAMITLDRQAEAVDLLAEAIGHFRGLGNRFGLGWALYVRSLLWLREEDVAAARADLAEALQIFTAADDLTGEVLVIDSIAEVVRRSGDAVRGARLAGAAKAHEVATGTGLNSIVGLREGWRGRDVTRTPEEQAAYAAGQAMPLEEAVAYALQSAAELSQAQ